MKKRIIVIALTLTALLVLAIILMKNGTAVDARFIRLEIAGPDGQPFSGSYVVDGVTYSTNATTPTNICVQARNVSFNFGHDSSNGAIRVTLFVGDEGCLSLTSGNGQGVRGEMRYSSKEECYTGSAY